MKQTALSLGLLGLIAASSTAASSSFAAITVESWQRGASEEVIYARASEETREVAEICVQWRNSSVRVPADAFRERGKFDPSRVKVWSSVGVRDGVRGGMTTTISFELDEDDPDADEYIPSTVHIDLRYTGGRVDPSAEVYFQSHSATQRGTRGFRDPDARVELEISNILPCPSPSSPRLGQAAGDV